MSDMLHHEFRRCGGGGGQNLHSTSYFGCTRLLPPLRPIADVGTDSTCTSLLEGLGYGVKRAVDTCRVRRTLDRNATAESKALQPRVGRCRRLIRR
jgi:hypothetical protein